MPRKASLLQAKCLSSNDTTVAQEIMCHRAVWLCDLLFVSVEFVQEPLRSPTEHNRSNVAIVQDGFAAGYE